jgi:hypothetical protein
MECPKCGTENPDGAEICCSCSCDLTGAQPLEPAPKRKVSVTAITSVLLAGVAAGLSVLVKPTWAFVAALFGFLSAIRSIGRIRKSKGRLIGKSFAIGAAIFTSLHIVVLSYWRIDAAPVPVDYTIADVRSAAPEYKGSYELLLSLGGEDDERGDAAPIGLSERDVKELEEIYEIFKEGDFDKISAGLIANAKTIETLWEKAKKGRDVVGELSGYKEIADLTEPSMEAEWPFLKNIRRLAYLYRSYICLQSCQGNEEIAIDELVRWNSVISKLSLNARSPVMKLVCYACLALDIMNANFVINNPKTSGDSLTKLSEVSIVPTKEHIALRNSLIFEYIVCKNELMKIYREWSMKYSLFCPLKLNSTCRLYKNFCDRWIAAEEGRDGIDELTVWPAIYPQLPVTLDDDANTPRYYDVYNPIGSMLVGIMVPAIDKVFGIKTKLEIHSDLLQIVLNKRLDRQASLKARAYGDEYIIDVEAKKIFSPGPDGEPNTRDDIELLINPEVLGLH